jgi:alpha-L-rhamnosidase
VLGLEAEAAELAELSANIRDAWETEYLDDAGLVTRASQANCVRALAFDLVSPEHRAAVTTQLVDLVRAAGTHLGTGFLATPYLLPVLAGNGEQGLAYELLLQDTEPSWLAMVNRGATTVWELWNGIDAAGTARQSLNHYSKGAVVSFLHRYTAGLRQAPGSAGWERVIIEPRPGGGITSASTSHQGPRGLALGCLEPGCRGCRRARRGGTSGRRRADAHCRYPARHHRRGTAAGRAGRRRRTRTPHLPCRDRHEQRLP